MSDDYLPAAEAAARWWAETISGRVLHKAIDFSAKQPARDIEYGLVTAGIMGRIADAHPVSEEQAEKFATLFTAVVLRGLEHNRDRDYQRLHFGVDYGPDMELGQVAEQAGINGARFPIKTRMGVEPDHITVAEGYGAPHRLIWAAEDYVRPRCDGHEFFEDVLGYYRRTPNVCTKPRWHEGDGDTEHRYDAQVPLCAHCNNREDDWQHGTHDIQNWLSHGYEEGALRCCARCGKERLLCERGLAQQDRTQPYVCGTVGPPDPNDPYSRGTWLPDDTPHEWTTDARTAVSAA